MAIFLLNSLTKKGKLYAMKTVTDHGINSFFLVKNRRNKVLNISHLGSPVPRIGKEDWLSRKRSIEVRGWNAQDELHGGAGVFEEGKKDLEELKKACQIQGSDAESFHIHDAQVEADFVYCLSNEVWVY